MPAELHETSLIALLAIGFGLALLFGLLASSLRISPIGGDLMADRDAQVNPESNMKSPQP